MIHPATVERPADSQLRSRQMQKGPGRDRQDGSGYVVLIESFELFNLIRLVPDSLTIRSPAFLCESYARFI